MLTVVVASVAILGCSGHKTASPTSTTSVTRARASTTTSSIVLPEGTWTFGTGVAGFAAGRMHITGGLPHRNGQTPDEPLAGIVEVHHPGDPTVLTRVTVDRTGTFRIDLPAGNYELVGRPDNTGIMSMHSREFAIDGGRTASVDLVDIAS